MFGYVKPYNPTLLVGDKEYYGALYCGVCQALKKETGIISSLTLNYDLVFLSLVRSIFDEKEITIKPKTCIAHPIKKRPMVEVNKTLSFCAKVCTILTYYKLKDDGVDEKFFKRLLSNLGKATLFPNKQRVKELKLEELIKQKLVELSELELKKVSSVDLPAQVFGELLGSLFAFGKEGDEYQNLYDFGLGLGKFIYIADAAEDYEEDLKKSSYNPFILLYGTSFGKEQKEDIHASLLALLSSIEETWQHFPANKTPASKRILENIMYDGLTHRIDFLIGIAPEKKMKPYTGPLP